MEYIIAILAFLVIIYLIDKRRELDLKESKSHTSYNKNKNERKNVNWKNQKENTSQRVDAEFLKNNANLRFVAGEFLKAHSYEDAILAYNHLISENQEENLEFEYRKLTEAYLKNNQLNRAIHTCKEGLNRFKNSVKLAEQLLDLHIENKDYLAAEKALEYICKLDVQRGKRLIENGVKEFIENARLDQLIDKTMNNNLD